MGKFTVIWQSKTPSQFEWINELFGPFISDHVFDGEHEVVLDNAILIDAFINRYDEGYYRKFAGKNAFLVHALDETYRGGYERYLNFKGVFRDHYSSKFNRLRVFDIPNGYRTKRPSTSPAKSALERPYIWSMVGEMNKSTRPEVLSALLPHSPFFILGTGSIYLPGDSKRPKAVLDTEKYYEVMENSVFSPAPMGNVNIGSYRMYEALEAGSIPIVEKRFFLDYYKSILGQHPIPTIASWSDAAALMDSLLKRPDRLVSLQNECTEFWSDFKIRIRRDIEEFILANSRGAARGRMYSPLINMRFFSYVELLKHHSVGAIFRRIKRQYDRLRSQGRWRVS